MKDQHLAAFWWGPDRDDSGRPRQVTMRVRGERDHLPPHTTVYSGRLVEIDGAGLVTASHGEWMLNRAEAKALRDSLDAFLRFTEPVEAA